MRAVTKLLYPHNRSLNSGLDKAASQLGPKVSEFPRLSIVSRGVVVRYVSRYLFRCSPQQITLGHVITFDRSDEILSPAPCKARANAVHYFISADPKVRSIPTDGGLIGKSQTVLRDTRGTGILLSSPMNDLKVAFRSLKSFNYRVWACGAIVSNVGTWMQRTAQDWLVLTQLTHHNATAVGVVMALQFGPLLLFLPLTGFAADHLDRRKLLIATQAAMGALALALGILTVAGSSSCGTYTCLRFCSGALRRSTHRRARPLSLSWSSKPTYQTPWRSASASPLASPQRWWGCISS